jgi:hypothetical protein
MKEHAADDYAAIKGWILACVGVYQPVFTVVISNSGREQTNIVQVQYDVKQLGQVLGGGPGGPVWPEITFDHELAYRLGVQSFPLKPIVNIPAGNTKAFNLRLSTPATDLGLGWYLSVRIVDAKGNAVTTDPFQLYLNPK